MPHSTSETLSEPRKDISLTSPSEVKELPIKNEEVQIPEKATLSAEGNSLPDGGTELSPDLRPTILSQLSKPTVQSNLKDHVLIEKIENNVVHLVATNKIAEMLLQNMDTKKELEEAFSKQLHTSTTISFIFEAKEAYFARTLGM
ncbi:MAG: hypothetical protein LBG52_05350 [Candidatus Peribacteria bacterium]|nr:hypothetical protein [Candidatus Peribacteria bacterium]